MIKKMYIEALSNDDKVPVFDNPKKIVAKIIQKTKEKDVFKVESFSDKKNNQVKAPVLKVTSKLLAQISTVTAELEKDTERKWDVRFLTKHDATYAYLGMIAVAK